LEGACLKGANLEYASLSGANLKNADLRACSVRGADLTGADLTGAEVSGTNFDSAEMHGCFGYMAEIFCFIIGDDYLHSASLSCSDMTSAAWYYRSSGESHHEWRIIKTEVLAEIAEKLCAQGTSEQTYDDGYDAMSDIGSETIIDSGDSSCDCSECGVLIADDASDPTPSEFSRIMVFMCDDCIANLHASDREWTLWMISALALNIQAYESKNGLALQYRLDAFVGMIWDKLAEDETQTESGIESALETLNKVSREWSASARSGMVAPVIEIAKWLQGNAVIDHIHIHLSENLTAHYKEMCENEIEWIGKEIDSQTRYFECDVDHSAPCDDDCDDDCEGHESECNCSCDIRLRVFNGCWSILVGDSSYDLDHRGVWGSGSISPQEDGKIVARQLIDTLGE